MFFLGVQKRPSRVQVKAETIPEQSTRSARSLRPTRGAPGHRLIYTSRQPLGVALVPPPNSAGGGHVGGGVFPSHAPTSQLPLPAPALDACTAAPSPTCEDTPGRGPYLPGRQTLLSGARALGPGHLKYGGGAASGRGHVPLTLRPHPRGKARSEQRPSRVL